MLAYIARRIVYVIPDRHQCRAGVLPAGASRARRSAGGDPAGGCLAGARGAAAHRLRVRSPASRAVRVVDLEGPARRPRHLHCHRPSRPFRSHARGRQHHHAGLRRCRHRLLDGPAAWADRRLLPQHLDRQSGDFDRCGWRLGTALLARHRAGHHLFGAAQLAARSRRRAGWLQRLELGLGAPALSRSARNHHGRDPDGNRDPHRARADRRYPVAGLRRSAARQSCAKPACFAT